MAKSWWSQRSIYLYSFPVMSIHCSLDRFNAGTFFIGFFEFGQGHRGPVIPYCLGAP
ncbi:unnamed protein product, partial [Staurois parvus]